MSEQVSREVGSVAEDERVAPRDGLARDHRRVAEVRPHRRPENPLVDQDVRARLRRARVARDRLGEPNRALDVEQAVALRDQAVPRAEVRRQLLRGVAEQRLDLTRLEARVRLQHQRDGARDHRRGHRRAAHLEVELFGVRRAGARDREGDRRRIVLGDVAVGRGRRDDPDARGDQVGFRRAVDERRTARAEVGDRVVRPRVRAVRVGRADRDHGRQVRRRDDAAVDGRAVGVAAGVARRDDADDPGVDRRLDRLAERVETVGLDHRRADREVGDADVVGVLVRDHPADAGDHVAQRARAVAADDANVDQLGVEREAAVLLVRVDERRALERLTTVAGRDPGDVRSVAVGIVVARPNRVVGDEVRARDDPVRRGRVEVAEVLVIRRAGIGDARVDDRDPDVRAVVPARGQVLHVGRELAAERREPRPADDLVAGRRDAQVIRVVPVHRRARDPTVEGDSRHARNRRDREDLRRRKGESDSVDERKITPPEQPRQSEDRNQQASEKRHGRALNDDRDRRQRGRRDGCLKIEGERGSQKLSLCGFLERRHEQAEADGHRRDRAKVGECLPHHNFCQSLQGRILLFGIPPSLPTNTWRVPHALEQLTGHAPKPHDCGVFPTCRPPPSPACLHSETCLVRECGLGDRKQCRTASDGERVRRASF